MSVTIINGINLADLSPIGGNPTFETVTLSNTSNQLIFGVAPNQTIINAPTPTGDAILTLPNTTGILISNNNILGTANQITVTPSGSDVTLSFPSVVDIQTLDIGTVSTTSLTNAVIFPSGNQKRLIVLKQVTDNDNQCSSIGTVSNGVIFNLPATSLFWGFTYGTSASTFNYAFAVNLAPPSNTTVQNAILYNNSNPAGYYINSAVGTAQTILGYCYAPGNFCIDSGAGDSCLTAAFADSLRFGTGSGTSIMGMSQAGVYMNQPLTLNNVAADNTQTNMLVLTSAGLVESRTISSLPFTPSTLTANSAVYVNSSGVLTAITLSSGQLLIGSTAAPLAANLTGTTNQIEITNNSGGITIGFPAIIDASTIYVGTPLTTSLTNALVFNSATQVKIVLYQTANNAFSYYGFGVTPGGLQYFIPGTNASHEFIAGNASSGSSTANNTIFTINGSGTGTSLNNIQNSSAILHQIQSSGGSSDVNFFMTTNTGQVFTSSATNDGGIQVTSTSNSCRLGVGSGTAQVVIANTAVTINQPLALTSVANDNSQTSIIMTNPSNVLVYRTVASLGIPATNSTVTYQNLILTGTANTYVELESLGYFAIDSSGGNYFTNSIASDVIIKQVSNINNILIGVGGTAQLVIGPSYTTTNTYITGGGTAPSIAPQTAAGTGAVAAMSTSPTGGIITLTTGSTGTTTTGIQAIITIPMTPVLFWGINFSPGNLASASVSPFIYMNTTSRTTFTITSGTPLTFGTGYLWNWSICL